MRIKIFDFFKISIDLKIQALIHTTSITLDRGLTRLLSGTFLLSDCTHQRCCRPLFSSRLTQLVMNRLSWGGHESFQNLHFQPNRNVAVEKITCYSCCLMTSNTGSFLSKWTRQHFSFSNREAISEAVFLH